MSEIELFSYSKLDTFINCPFKYKLKYLDGYYIRGESLATELGTAIHATEEQIANKIKNNEEIDYTSLKNSLLLEKMKLEYKYPIDWSTLDKSERTYSDKIKEYLNTGIYRLERYMKEHPTYEILGSEVEFNFEYNEQYAFRGFIDRLLLDKTTNTYIIQDIKTYAVPLESSKLTTPLQFVIYALAVEKMFPEAVGHIKCGYDLPFCDTIQNAGTSGFISRGKLKLDSLFKELLVSDFAPKTSPLCNWCEFSKNGNTANDARYLCPYFCHWTRQKKDFSVENKWAGQGSHKTILESYLAKNGITIEVIDKLRQEEPEEAREANGDKI